MQWITRYAVEILPVSEVTDLQYVAYDVVNGLGDVGDVLLTHCSHLISVCSEEERKRKAERERDLQPLMEARPDLSR